MHKSSKQNKTYQPLPSSSGAPGDWAVTDDRWIKEKQHWTDTAGGKAAIEFVSRIALGSIFYSLVENSNAAKKLGTYRRSKHLGKKARGETSILENIAYFLDNTVGKTLYKVADAAYFHGALAKDDDGKTLIDDQGREVTEARQSLRFRENRSTHGTQALSGRSLGAEMTTVTASFAAMSTGTAIMRNILSGIFSPKERASWSNKDGKFDPAHIAKKVAGKIWQIGTYNAGEDMAVALPYVFFMRAQRNMLDKVFHGFKYSSDGVDNGGGYRLGDDGKITNHMMNAGALDLQGRFTVYNVFTQLYRDIYNKIGGSITQWWKDGKQIKAPTWLKEPASIPSKFIGGARNLLRYTTISTIRSIIYMTPAVPFFSIFRVPGSKVNGMAVHAEHGALHFTNNDGSLGTPIRANLGAYYYKGEFYKKDGSKGHDERYDYGSNPKMQYADGTTFNGKTSFFSKIIDGKQQFEPNGFGSKGRKLHESPIMRATDSIARFMHKTAESDAWLKYSEGIFKLAGYRGDDKNTKFMRKRLAKDAMMAGIPYASYFSAKVLARETYVNEQMNMAVERLVDGVLGLNKNEISAGISEITSTIMRQPFEDPERAAKLINLHIDNPSDKSPRPIDWNADLHKEATEHIANGEEFDTNKVVSRLNKERSDYFSKRANQNNTIDDTLNKAPADKWADKKLEASELENSTHMS